jgi:hypothetical protein
MPCPHCASSRTIKRPDHTALGYRRFRCCNCKRTFNERAGTLFNYLQYPTDVVCLVVLWRHRYKLSLPFVDSFRTLCLAPAPEMKAVFNGFQLPAPAS